MHQNTTETKAPLTKEKGVKEEVPSNDYNFKEKNEPSSSACRRQTWRAWRKVEEPCPSMEPASTMNTVTEKLA
ncbi:S-malonyltransferasea [Sesbania bispinosa]|nr:S-malonyltransferasea [Sesbania bispinosa]